MNDASEFPRPAETGAQKVNGHTGPADTLSDTDSVSVFQKGGVGERAGRRRMWPSSWKHHPEPGSANGNDEFLAVFSHELRNSLGVIRNATVILSAEASEAPAGMKARLLIERQVAQMTRLVEDLLDEARIRSGHLHLRRERIDLCSVVTQSVQSIEFTMQQHHHRMTTTFPDPPMWMQADPARLEQVFVNLLDNAAKFTDAGGKIDLSVERKQREAIIRVRDTGIGISPEVLPDLFRLFVQADPTSSRRGGGLGIGLALVRSLVESHGGRISAESAGLGQGTEFTIRLPLCEAPWVA